MTLPDQIRKIIKESKKSQRQMAKDAEMPVNSLKRIKGEKWGTQLLQAVKLLQSLGKDLIIVDNNKKAKNDEGK